MSGIGYVHGEPMPTGRLIDGITGQEKEAVAKLAAEVSVYRASDREIWQLAAATDALRSVTPRPEMCS